MMDPKKLLDRLPRFDKDRPFRFLARRVVQAMVEAATANLVLGQRTAPGSYLVVRLVESARERDHWEQLFAESRAAILQEIEREAAARDVKTRSTVAVELVVLTDEQAARGEPTRILSTAADEPLDELEQQLYEAREVILPRRTRTLLLESDPPEAQAYLDNRPVGVTPCRVEDITPGEHALTFSRRGYLLYEDTFTVEPGASGERLRYEAFLDPEPSMGVLEIQTFPPRARVTVKGETRPAPAQWRLPTGEYSVTVSLPEYESVSFQIRLPNSDENAPYRVAVRLDYNGPQRDEVVGRLIVYKPGAAPPPPPREDPDAHRIRDFFREADPEPEVWDAPAPPPTAPLVALGERLLRRGVVLIGREDATADIRPDVRLFDPENSVSRGCHAWLWVYADRSTGAAYNTFLIGNNSPAGIRVDGQLVTETRRLSDDSLIEIGNFKMRVVKEATEARVEL